MGLFSTEPHFLVQVGLLVAVCASNAPTWLPIGAHPLLRHQSTTTNPIYYMMSYIQRFRALFALSLLSLLITTPLMAQTPPNLGTTATYGAFSGEGAIENTGLTVIQGDVGTNAGAFTGFPPGLYTGAKHVADPAALVAKNDLINAYNLANLIPCDTAIGVTMGNGQVFTPRTYCSGAQSTIDGAIIFDAKGDGNAVFVVKIGGALNAAANTQINLVNGASAANIYWIVDGAVSILDNSTFYGTIIADGAIHLYGGSTITGRLLAVVGAVTMASNLINVPTATPPSSLTVVRPNAGDSIMAGTQNYEIVWTATNITNIKKLEYSIDGGLNWILIDNIDSTSSHYAWDVPMVASNNVVIRVTDNNGVTDNSGVFTIYDGTVTPSLIVVRPGLNEVIIGGTQNYQITWSGNGIDNIKSFEYSLDAGATWRSIGSMNADIMTYPWNVPDSATTRGLVRITDKNGLTGTSGLFTILSSTVPALVVTSPMSGERVVRGTQNYQITWTGVGLAANKTIEYSTDNGATWILIANVNSDAMSYGWNVPDAVASAVIIRITDGANVTGTSGVFSIVEPGVDGSINSLTLTGLTNNNIGNGQNLNIAWTFTPDIGPMMMIEFTTDGGLNWNAIQTVNVNETTSVNWTTPMTGNYPVVQIRITSTKGMTRTSEPFSIGATNSVSSLSALGYALSNYPNPVSDMTTISFTLPVAGSVMILITDATGRELMRLAPQASSIGTQTMQFDASQLPSGNYYYSLLVDGQMMTRRMNVVR